MGGQPCNKKILIKIVVFQEICLAAYRGVIQPESEDKRIISAQWAKDEDIARFLRLFLLLTHLLVPGPIYVTDRNCNFVVEDCFALNCLFSQIKETHIES